jgi:CubicO group peptidase (beta-lactamase class C family)
MKMWGGRGVRHMGATPLSQGVGSVHELSVSLAGAIVLAGITGLGAVAPTASAQRENMARAIDAYVQPYVETNNFSGQLVVMKGDDLLYERHPGWANRESRVPMTRDTQLHIASISTQFTAAAIMRLIDEGKLSLDTRVAEIVPGIRGGDAITMRHLLEQRSGLSDINARPDYTEILKHHQTPATLVAFVSGDSLQFEPGSRYVHEEHSAYNLLALIIEKKSGLPFAQAMQKLVFAPLAMSHSSIDDDLGARGAVADGYDPKGVYDLVATTPIHWSAKSGNASVRTSAMDEARWVRRLFRGHAFGDATRAAIVDSAGVPFGYGWFRRPNKRFGEFAYSMSGRSPGFASYVIYLPREDVTVVAFSNIYSSATSDIANDIAAIALGVAYTPVALRKHPISPDSLGVNGARFTFPADFYQPNATLAFEVDGGELFLRWPSNDLSPVIPIDRDHAIDRAYWQAIAINRDSTGNATSISYDRFRGERETGSAAAPAEHKR